MAFQVRTPLAAATSGGGTAWTTPSNGRAEDGSVTTCILNGGQSTQNLQMTTYNFTIPGNSIIVGIELRVKKNRGVTSGGATLSDNGVFLIGGSGTSSDKTKFPDWPTVLTWFTYGSPTDTWGLSWTPAEINATTFGSSFRAIESSGGGATRPRVDAHEITVYYQIAGALFKQISHGINARSSQGPNDGSSFTTSGSGQTWTTPSNIQTSNDVKSLSTLLNAARTSRLIQATGFNFAIPVGYFIRGILLEVEKRIFIQGAGSSAIDLNVRLLGGSGTSSDYATATSWPATDAYVSYGGSTDLWGLPWTVAEINASTFGCEVSVQLTGSNTTAVQIDHVRLTVYYSSA